MPRIQKQKIAIGHLVLSIEKMSTSPDIGNPAKARVDTLKWLKREGPVPEQFNIVLQDDEEALDHYRKYLWNHPEPAATPGSGVHQFITAAGAAEKDLLKSEQNRRQRATREQAQKNALLSKAVREKDSEKWMDYARMVFDRGGDDTPLQMATRIQEELLEAGWVTKADWKNLSKTERRDTDTGYYPSIDRIARFLRKLAKTQPQ